MTTTTDEDVELAVRHVLDTEPPTDSVTDRVALQRYSGVAVVTLTHPQARNALNLASWIRLRSLFDRLAGDRSLRAVVLRGAGDKAFAAGADIKEFPDTRMSAGDAAHYNDNVAGALRALTAIPIPVIAAIRGLAVGGGCELSTACDVRIATTDAKFGIPVGKLGVILGLTEADSCTRLMGPANLKYLLFSGELIDAEEAVRWGLVQRLVRPDELSEATAKLVAQICRQSPTTMRASKVIVNMHGRALTAADTDMLTSLSIAAYEGNDRKEGVAAFTEGRPLRFDQRQVR
jgi:enoyl-CoA hydratase